VRGFEPESALVPGPLGTEHFLPLARQAALALKSGGLLLLECGAAQARMLEEQLRGLRPWRELRVLQDAAGLDRLLLAEK
jgi:release factor glutamine methyltransferase